uniref:Protein kinase domain-containing protein n=1 Tax=Maylandia zebra TaxID=106582 RepID=A0A3P9DJZ9_9CICH
MVSLNSVTYTHTHSLTHSLACTSYQSLCGALDCHYLIRLSLDPNQRITPSEVLHHPFFNPGLSKSSPCTDMSSTGGQNLVVSQQPSSCKREESQKISCSSQYSEEFSQQEYVNASSNTSSSIDDLEISKGTFLGGHYKVEGFLGEGGFGIVTKCCNTKTNKFVAIKVNKNKPEILQQAKMEIFILEQLRGLDADRCNIVQWNDFFINGDRICLNFELLDQCLWDYIEDPENQGLPISEIRPILHQLTNALSHLGSVGIVHADLKPENIMVVDRYECPIKVKLIDFGVACPASTVIPGDCVGTVGYKAPEVMIGSLYNELATGYPFYPGRDDYDVLKFIIQTQGQPPDHTERQFQDETDYQSNDTRSIKLKCLDDLGLLLSIMWGREKIQNVFVSLIKEMLALDPNQRITPSEVLHHPFFSSGLSESSP